MFCLDGLTHASVLSAAAIALRNANQRFQAGLRAYEWYLYLADCLPTSKRSGRVIRRNSLTVAGAAPELSWFSPVRTGFPFHPLAGYPWDT